MDNINRKTFRKVLLLFVGGFLLIIASCKEKEIVYTFTFNNHRAGYQIKSLTLAGDFNNWSVTQTPLSDADGNGIWQVRVPLTQGAHFYRFVLNGKKWLRDPANPFYGGRYSNSYLFADKIKYPRLLSLYPADGSWLYKEPKYLQFCFDRKISNAQAKGIFLIDDRPLSLIGPDSLFRRSFPDLFEGRHHWDLRIENKKGTAVYAFKGLWVVNYHNQKPLAKAGYTRFVCYDDSVSLDGGCSFDPDFEPLRRFYWQEINGPRKVILQGSNTPFVKFKAEAPGRYVFRLTVRDSLGRQASDTTEVVVFTSRRPKSRFVFNAASFDHKIYSVALVGEFNQWNKTANPLQPNTDSTRWSVELPLDKGRYEYKFVVNGNRWLTDTANPKKIADGWQGFNSVRDVSGQREIKMHFTSETMAEKNYSLVVRPQFEGPQNLKINWRADIQNPGGIFTVKGKRLFFESRNPKGSYFFYCLFSGKNIRTKQRTVLINHYKKTEAVDFDASPAWADRAIIYEVYLRRFGPTRNFNALRKALPQLKNLGVNTLWLMPIYEGPTQHGYAPTNLFAVNKDYGSLAAYRQLIQAAHAKGFKVIFDFVANHLSDQHRFVIAAKENPLSPLRRWFYWRADGSWGYHNDWDALVNLNYDLPMVRHYILDAAGFWLSQGVDGFRCDAAWAVPHSFWKDFRREIKKINSQCLLIDEVLPRQVAFHQQEFDMSYDTDFYGNLLDVMQGRKPISALPCGLEKTASNYPATAKSLRYMENQDLTRFLKIFGEKETRLAAVILFTIPGTPLIYYGQENGVRQQRPYYNFTTRSKWFDFYRSLIKFRTKNTALTKGNFKTVRVDDRRKLWIYDRQWAGSLVRVVINLSYYSRVIKIPAQHTIINIEGSQFKRLGQKILLKGQSFLISKKTAIEKKKETVEEGS